MRSWIVLPGSDIQEPPGKLVTKEYIDMCRMTSEITHLWACDKVIFKTGIPVHCLGIDKRKERQFSSKSDGFPKSNSLGKENHLNTS